jgi:hypothetical protein
MVNRSALGANKDLIAYDSAGCKLACVAPIANFRIVIAYAIAGEVQCGLVWKVNL